MKCPPARQRMTLDSSPIWPALRKNGDWLLEATGFAFAMGPNGSACPRFSARLR